MPKLVYQPEIDGLRAIAVMSVVLYHADPGLLPGGFVGVDVFFVISGYLITALLTEEWRETGRIDIAAFYARRAKRLLPALLLVIAVVLVLSAWFLGPLGSPLHRVTDSAMAALVFAGNFYFQFNAGGYFSGPSDEMPFLHLWSLAVEEQYYLIYPAMLWLVLAKAPHRLSLGLGLGALASLALAEHWLQLNPSAAFYQMPARFWELAVGAMVALSPRLRLADGWTNAIVGAGLCLIGAACMLTSPSGHFPGVGAIIPTAGAAMVLLALRDSPKRHGVGAVLRFRPLVAVGLLSYSFYLWHWPLLALDRAANFEPSGLTWRLGLCALALGLAWMTYRTVEAPFRRARRPARTVAVQGASAVLVVAGLALIVSRTSMLPEEIDALVERTAADRPPHMDRCHFDLSAEVVALKAEDCDSFQGRPPRIAVWGDSHALAWQPFAWRLAEVRGESAASFTMDSCPPQRGYSGYRADYPGHGDNCARLNVLALERLSIPGAFDTVVLGRRWPMVFSPPGGTSDATRIELEMDRAVEALDQVLAELAHVPEVIVFAPLPVLRADAGQCIAAGLLKRCALPRVEFDLAASPLRRRLSMVAAKYPNVVLVDPTTFFCDAHFCAVVRDGYSLYWDDDHVAATAARAFAQRFIEDPTRYTRAAAYPTAARP